ncbi:hypothetical protein [Brevibacillus sp. NRS-1366]|uniref:hypothetical protein n=1 Tax=Brevibacillus sp. NRS-1366 TaxID=3233899 RepID=UPI003D22E1A1
MKKWVVSALLMCMAMGTLLSGVTVSPALGAVATSAMKQNSQVSKPAQQPVHDMIVFNGYQVSGLDANGWNWVKNDEFILPPDTPLDIDLIQTTYGSGTNLNRHEVLLDNVPLPALSGEKRFSQAALKWDVPRFSIPASQLSSGLHTLTFVVTDAKAQKSTVQVRFQVGALTNLNIYEGNKAVGESIPSGGISGIFGMFGTKNFTSTVSGTWKLINKTNGKEIKTISDKTFTSGNLMQGQYELIFTPDDGSLPVWTNAIQVGTVDLYMGSDANGQKLSDNQKITAPAAPGQVELFSLFPGRWWVNGTGQTLSDSQHFNVVIPEMLAGMTLTVTFEPTPGNSSSGSKSSATTVQIQIPGAPNACEAADARVTMDILTQKNRGSSLNVEREDLYSSNATIKIYQDPIYKIWLATAANHFKYGTEIDDEEGPGVWAIDNVIVEASKLNWDHTALDLSDYKPGRYKINYYGKRDPKQTWCGYIQIIEDRPPSASAPVCDPSDSGVAPPQAPMRLVTKKGKEYHDGQNIVVDSSKDLEDLQGLKLMSTYVEKTGTKKIKLDGRNYYMPKLVWSYGENAFGSSQAPNTMQMTSQNKAEVLFDGKVISTIKPGSRYEEDDEGIQELDVNKIIERNDSKPGEYTIRITNTLGYTNCQVFASKKSYNKKTSFDESEEILTLTIDVK